jgi:hypothetical protein
MFSRMYIDLTIIRMNEERTRSAVGRDGNYLLDRQATDTLPGDYVLIEFFRFCQTPNDGEINFLSELIGTSWDNVDAWCKYYVSIVQLVQTD